MLVMDRLALPLFVKVTFCGVLDVPTVWLPKFRLVGLSDAEGPTATPVPVKLAVCGLPGALSVTVIVPVRVPATVGVKVTLMLQFEPAAREVPQVLVCAKSPLLAMLVIDKLAVPVLLNVIFCAALVVPTFWLPNVRLVGLSEATGPLAPQPVNLKFAMRVFQLNVPVVFMYSSVNHMVQSSAGSTCIAL